MALEAAGILAPEDLTTRVVIDAAVNKPLMIYIENLGDTRVLDIATHPDLKVAVVRRSADEDA